MSTTELRRGDGPLAGGPEASFVPSTGRPAALDATPPKAARRPPEPRIRSSDVVAEHQLARGRL